MKDWENDTWIISSLENCGILSSLTGPWSLAISLAHKKKFQTAPYSAIGDNHKTEKTRNEDYRKKLKHKKMWKFTFRHPHASSKNSQTTFYPFYKQIGSRTKNSLCLKFCSTAVGLLSRRSNLVSKRKRNQKLTAKNFEAWLTSLKEEIFSRKSPICYTEQKLMTRTRSFFLLHPLFNLPLSHQTSSTLR